MASIAPPPSFTSAPRTYDQRYFDSLLDDLRRIIVQLNNPGPLVCSSIQVLQLPTTGSGLPPGSFYNSGGTVKVVQPGDTYAGTFLLNMSLGSVTVI